MAGLSGIPQVRGTRYLAVNVYPSPTGWRVAVIVRESGRPYPRLVQQIPLPDYYQDRPDLPSALKAASEGLLWAAENLELETAR